MYPDVVLILSHHFFFMIETHNSSISLMFHQQQPTMTTHVAADCGRLWIWVNYNELTTSSLEIIVSKGNHPQMALIQVSELL